MHQTIVPPDADGNEDNESKEFRRNLARARYAITVEDFKKLGYTEGGAKAMATPDAGEVPATPKAWLDEWDLWHYGKSVWGGAAFTPFPIGAQHTGYEWLLLSAGRDPNHPWFRAIAERPEDFDNREKLLLAFAPDAYRNLCRSIDRGRVEPDRWAYRQNQRGETEIDITRCGFSREAMRDSFRRIGVHSDRLAELLADDLSKPMRTGAPGRPPKGMHLIKDEFTRREAARTAREEPPNSLAIADEAKELLEWFKNKYPTAERPAPKTITNGIRQLAPARWISRRSARN
jgi:hypothetical protein